MAIKISFDPAGNPESPAFILAHRRGSKIGSLRAKSVHVKDCGNEASEISFQVNKYVDGTLDPIWDEIDNFKLAWCKEWDTWFQITVETDEDDKTVKHVSGTQLGQAELSQIMLYNIEINTENDILREDYERPTVLYDAEHKESSLLHRLLEKAPHYSIVHVDPSIAGMQRTFTFDDTSIVDAFQDISEEIGCLFQYPTYYDASGKLRRGIAVYDLMNICDDCGYRGEFMGKCPKCGSKNITTGYGEDTTIFLTADDLANSISFTTDTDSVKNCFKLEAGDDLMTATVRNCNPNGSDYIWYISDISKKDMSKDLVSKLDTYDTQYEYYQSEHSVQLPSQKEKSYNDLVNKYKTYRQDLGNISSPIVGYPNLMNAYYNTVDLDVYLQSGLMPTVEMSDTNAAQQAALLTASRLSPVSVTNLDVLSLTTADNAILGMARAIVDSRYSVKVQSSTLSQRMWSGVFEVTNYSDDEDTALSGQVSIVINDDYAVFVKQKIEKAMAKVNGKDTSISGLFEQDLNPFCGELKKYCLDSLNGFLSACQSCIDILMEQGVADSGLWNGINPNLYETIYVPYYQKLQAIQAEIAVRENELATVHEIQDDIINERNRIQDALDFQKFLGEDLWFEFCAYRRESKYSNSNYTSEGLDNAELFDRALEFLNAANEDLYKSATLQHSISAPLKNLLIIDKFKPIVEHFQVGNWMRIRIDGNVYKLRLLEYEVDFDSLENINVQFSDVMDVKNCTFNLKDVLSSAASMATSYDTVQRQASQGADGRNQITSWVKNGLDATYTKIIGGADNQTQVWDEHGLSLKKYDPITNDYEQTQMKLLNSTILITSDAWKTVKTAVGRYFYFDPVTGKLTEGYGVNAETIIGRFILGENLGIYSQNNALTFTKDGLSVTNGTNSFTVNPNDRNLFKLSAGREDILYVDTSGVLHIRGEGSGLDLTLNSSITNAYSLISANSDAITAEVNRASTAEGSLSASISVNASGISTEVSRAKEVEGQLSTSIQQNANQIVLKLNSNGEIASVALGTSADKGTVFKVKANNIDLSASETISLLAGGDLDLTGKNITISSTNFSVDANGDMECHNITAFEISGNAVNQFNKTVTDSSAMQAIQDAADAASEAKSAADGVKTTVTNINDTIIPQINKWIGQLSGQLRALGQAGIS